LFLAEAVFFGNAPSILFASIARSLRKPHRPDSPRLGPCVLHVFRFPTGNTRSRVFSNQLNLGKLSTALDLTAAQRP
jgi:hypothetical protein